MQQASLLAAQRAAAASQEATAARQLAARSEALRGEASAAASSTGASLQQAQHSLYVVRAHWGSLRKALAQLHGLMRQQAVSSLSPSRRAAMELATRVRRHGMHTTCFILNITLHVPKWTPRWLYPGLYSACAYVEPLPMWYNPHAVSAQLPLSTPCSRRPPSLNHPLVIQHN